MSADPAAGLPPATPLAVRPRVRRAPALEPPYEPLSDDPAAGTHLRLVPPGDQLPFDDGPGTRRRARTGRHAGGCSERPAPDDTAQDLADDPVAEHRAGRLAAPRQFWDFWGPQPTGRGDLPDPRPVAGRFVCAALEVLAGCRHASQLRSSTSAAVYADLTRTARFRAMRARSASDAAPRTATPKVRSVRVSEPADGVAEVSAVIDDGRRCHAVAARLEGIDGQWRCVGLHVG